MPLTNRRTSPAPMNMNLYRLEGAINGYDALFVLSSRQSICTEYLERIYRRNLQLWENASLNVRQALLFKRFFWLARDYVAQPLPTKYVAFPAATTAFVEGQFPALRLRTRRAVSDSAVSERVDVTPVDVPEAAHSVCLTKERAVLPDVKTPPLHSALSLTLRGEGTSRLFTKIEDLETGEVWPGFVHTAEFLGRPPIVLQIPLPDFRSVRISVWARPCSEPAALFIESADILSDLQDEDQLIQITRFTPNTVSLNVGSLRAPRILTFLDSAYPGWKVEVDGRPAPMRTAFKAFKAVYLEAGTHNVKFMFRPKKAAAGAGVSLVTLTAGILALWHLRPRNEERPKVT